LRVLSATAVIVLLLAIASMAAAHHSNAMFDKAALREVTVTVRAFQWTNPHVWIQVDIENTDGDIQEWSIEGGGPNSLFRKGWRPDTFKPGDIVDMKFFPMRDGSSAALFVGAKFADGTTIGDW